ncbi:hypothetical protein BOTBODRAFT_51018 [Botryobasidium botryosum FD-172 SS1]|uniref:Histone H1 n=1 Tax=Botryobasidium botryosum (strain FD-172 SS1) TaxID=930990 RepID=A0A067N216_BOTB1|nr:hypothetical protein BOTBODRAFT_51018 [Botryobasidium botryosum FD-172 SS1]
MDGKVNESQAALKATYLSLLPHDHLVALVLTLEAKTPDAVNIWPESIEEAISTLQQAQVEHPQPQSRHAGPSSQPDSSHAAPTAPASAPTSTPAPSHDPQQGYVSPPLPPPAAGSSPFAPPTLSYPVMTYPPSANNGSGGGRSATNAAYGMPSYEEMIIMALTEVGEPDGTMPKVLFQWMSAHWPLMNNFRPSASQALHKALKRGRLEKIGNKYRLNPNWEGGNTSRRTTRRPQIGATPMPLPMPMLLPSIAPPPVPFSNAPLAQNQPAQGQTPSTTSATEAQANANVSALLQAMHANISCRVTELDAAGEGEGGSRPNQDCLMLDTPAAAPPVEASEPSADSSARIVEVVEKEVEVEVEEEDEDSDGSDDMEDVPLPRPKVSLQATLSNLAAQLAASARARKEVAAQSGAG